VVFLVIFVVLFVWCSGFFKGDGFGFFEVMSVIFVGVFLSNWWVFEFE